MPASPLTTRTPLCPARAFASSPSSCSRSLVRPRKPSPWVADMPVATLDHYHRSESAREPMSPSIQQGDQIGCSAIRESDDRDVTLTQLLSHCRRDLIGG